ncbi:hypothetical protein [Paenirhodobacter enshiensis]|uniref:hypothetical protein n=1 Tax=Paenirhodobacter enshiensis TaxID=1105367 RepID=UPI0035AE0E83
MTQAPEMPAQIWAYPQDWQSTRGRWHNVPVQHADAAEYRRADLPPTPAEAMRCPEVAALVEAMRNAIVAIDAAYDGPDDNGRYSTRERSALAAMEQEAPE